MGTQEQLEKRNIPDDKKYLCVIMNKNGALLLQKVELLIYLIHDREHDRRTRKLLSTTLSSLTFSAKRADW